MLNVANALALSAPVYVPQMLSQSSCSYVLRLLLSTVNVQQHEPGLSTSSHK